jgi:hypothetical protein
MAAAAATVATTGAEAAGAADVRQVRMFAPSCYLFFFLSYFFFTLSYLLSISYIFAIKICKSCILLNGNCMKRKNRNRRY